MIKHIFIIAIKIYQKYFPKKFRGKCIYKISCSQYVLDETTDKGFYQGLKAFKYRFQNCRPGYYVIKDKDTGRVMLITKKHNIVEQEDISEKILKDFVNE